MVFLLQFIFCEEVKKVEALLVKSEVAEFNGYNKDGLVFYVMLVLFIIMISIDGPDGQFLSTAFYLAFRL